MPPPPLDLLQGTVDVMILRTLAWRPMHGYRISTFVHDRTDGTLALEGAALYQALHRLERKKLVRSAWGTSETGRRAKFYELTPEGRLQLQAETDTLRRYVAALFQVLEPG